MEASEGRGDLFRLTDPRQVRIYNRLLLVGPGPAAFYKDACRLVSEFPLLESTTHLVAHLLREIESALRDVLESMVKVADGSQVKGDLGQATHKAEIQSILKCLEIPMDDPVAEAWFSLADRESNYALHALAHRRQLIQPRPVDNEFRDFWNKAQTVLDAVLDRFEAHYISIFDAIEKVISKSPPSTKDLQDSQRKVPSNLVTRNYLFSRLSDCWLLPLKDAGFFKHPPGPVVDEQKQIVSFPTWPESQYLARMASKSPELVLEIVREIPDTDNVRIHESLADACLGCSIRLQHSDRVPCYYLLMT